MSSLVGQHGTARLLTWTLSLRIVGLPFPSISTHKLTRGTVLVASNDNEHLKMPIVKVLMLSSTLGPNV